MIVGTMTTLLRFAGAAGLALALALSGSPQTRRPSGTEDRDTQLPDLKHQQEEILKADHEKDLKDATQLIDLAEQLKQELEKNDRHVLSISSLKKTEEIEKLAKRIHSRLVR
jgi:hypothetical protein